MTVAEAHHATDHFLRWLSRGFSGCQFASHLARENEKDKARDRILCATFLEDLSTEDLPDIERLIDESAKRQQIALFLFPRLRTAESIGVLVSTLIKHERWFSSIVEWRAQSQDGQTPLSLEWVTSHGARSSAIGFAPLGSMPVTRRAPYVAIALWAGGHENQQKPSTREVIGFVDFPVPVDNQTHEKLWEGTKQDVRRLLSDPAEDVTLFRQVAFCLPDPVTRSVIG